MRRDLKTKAFLASALIALMVVLPGSAPAAEQMPMMIQALFVQNAKAVVFDQGALTLKGVSPMTVFFSDRPVRVAGHYHTKDEFLPLWDEGKDSFLKDPPNATVSIYRKGEDQLQDVVVTLSHPRLTGEDLTYDISLIEGKAPERGGECSVFIDIIGLPFTPLSFAGVARRTARRTVFWGAAATSAASAAAMTSAAASHPTTVVVNQAPAPAAPPAAPAEKSSQTDAVARLKQLKSMQEQGLITEAQYKAESQKILNELVK